MYQKVITSEINSDLRKTTYFHQTYEMGQVQTKTVLHHKMIHILLILVFHEFWSIFAENWQKSHISVEKETISERSLELPEKDSSFSNEFEMDHILPKPVLNFSIGKFIAILVFCNNFVWNEQKLMLWGKKWPSKKAQNWKKAFFIKHMNLDRYCRKIFYTAKWTTYRFSKLLRYFEAFSPEIDKKNLIWDQTTFLRKKLGITRDGLFSQTSVKRVTSSRKQF